MENFKTVKQYAAHAGVTVQSVYKRLRTPQNAAMLEGHIIQDRGTTYLDEYAVQFLDGTRPASVTGSPTIHQEKMIIELSDKVHQLQAENDALTKKTMEALERLTEAAQAAADSKVALADMQSRVKLLEIQNEASGDLLRETGEQLRQMTAEATQLRGDLDQARSENYQLQQDLIGMDQLRNDLREAENEVEGFRERYQAAEQESAGLRQDLRGADDQIRQLKTGLQAAEQEKTDLREDLRDADEEIQQLRDDFQKMKDTAAGYRERYHDATAAKEDAMQACSELQEDLKERDAELLRLKSRGLLARIFNR